jgi:hypothetical protein
MKSRRMKWVERVAEVGEIRSAHIILVGRSEGKTLLRRRRHRWMDDIEMDFKEITWEGVDWTHMAQDRDRWRAVVNTVKVTIARPQEGHIRDLHRCENLKSQLLTVLSIICLHAFLIIKNVTFVCANLFNAMNGCDS